MLKKTHKRRKRTRIRGRKTIGWGARKKHKKSGHRGGVGMAGTGKRADQKKTLVTALYGHKYFGKQGVTSRKTKKDKRKRINLSIIESNLENYISSGIAKKTKDGFELNLEDYKILGDGEVKNKLFIKAKEASKSAIEKIEKAGGSITTKDSKNKFENKNTEQENNE
ncbi:MAG: 50S ribosomal protein L15 [Candidatus Pacearchaeota archaeon]|nr:MAG: 50S ribosomal protein L15 [Candidatus Pacearchaeota archaeon]